MDTGKGVAFSEKWYDRMSNTSIKPEEKTLMEFTKDYDQNFNPFDTKLELGVTYRNSSKDQERMKMELLMMGSKSTSTSSKTLQPKPSSKTNSPQ